MTKFNGRITCDECGLELADNSPEPYFRWNLNQELITDTPLEEPFYLHEKNFCSLDCLKMWVDIWTK